MTSEPAIPDELLLLGWQEYVRVKHAFGRSGFVAFKSALAAVLARLPGPGDTPDCDTLPDPYEHTKPLTYDRLRWFQLGGVITDDERSAIFNELLHHRAEARAGVVSAPAAQPANDEAKRNADPSKGLYGVLNGMYPPPRAKEVSRTRGSALRRMARGGSGTAQDTTEDR